MAPPNQPLLLTGRTAGPRATRGGRQRAPQQSGRTFGGRTWCETGPGGRRQAPRGSWSCSAARARAWHVPGTARDATPPCPWPALFCRGSTAHGDAIRLALSLLMVARAVTTRSAENARLVRRGEETPCPT